MPNIINTQFNFISHTLWCLTGPAGSNDNVERGGAGHSHNIVEYATRLLAHNQFTLRARRPLFIKTFRQCAQIFKILLHSRIANNIFFFAHDDYYILRLICSLKLQCASKFLWRILERDSDRRPVALPLINTTYTLHNIFYIIYTHA